MIYQRAHQIVNDQIFLEMQGLVENSTVYVKLEGLNAAGSIKLKPAIAMIEDAERRGILTAGGHVIESTSGSLGVAIAMVCAEKGYLFTCVVDPNVSRQSLRTIRALGAHVVQVRDRDANGGYLGTRIAVIRERLGNDSTLLWLNQYANPANPNAHALGTATSILRELGHVDQVFIGAGTTGTLMGCAEHFRRFSPWTRIVAVDSVGSVTFGGAAGPRFVPGLGASRRPDIYRSGTADAEVTVPESEAVRMCRHVARTYGVLVGGSTGTVLAALAQSAEQIPPGSRVAAISPDMGDRYVDTVYDDDWVLDTFGPDPLIPYPTARDRAVQNRKVPA
ncbi:2,3-diaminopropionate biosynthesis protein SbnA [Rhodococcus sp. 06-235-1A]|uniref:2,3-diaminopropionate biosynthesis protein SbnA n=1 Tax=Rhodococcus sp. 06-235-1A TaxID=2022508 RepID=UPI000B9C1A43|nr:2,3-diaminopropionate biosynthesis protein SbnA [Rhodococcus sp. 06-235-1A]OZD01212.1 2,3-diaminopropionate biosynthesis protein SbnA [Rhodococcus sp. 06-235-1A]